MKVLDHLRTKKGETKKSCNKKPELRDVKYLKIEKLSERWSFALLAPEGVQRKFKLQLIQERATIVFDRCRVNRKTFKIKVYTYIKKAEIITFMQEESKEGERMVSELVAVTDA